MDGILDFSGPDGVYRFTYSWLDDPEDGIVEREIMSFEDYEKENKTMEEKKYCGADKQTYEKLVKEAIDNGMPIADDDGKLKAVVNGKVTEPKKILCKLAAGFIAGGSAVKIFDSIVKWHAPKGGFIFSAGVLTLKAVVFMSAAGKTYVCIDSAEKFASAFKKAIIDVAALGKEMEEEEEGDENGDE